jgi:LacI family repressor for deo operon, udp, cdd, tsx, nupC, and nupG
MKRKIATIIDVALAAKVSTATVSRALSKPELLSDDTRKAVFSAIKVTGYRANQVARNLRMKRAGAILVLVPNLGKPFYSKILSGISDGFSCSDYSVLISDTESQPMGEDELAGNLLDGRVDGVLSLDGNLSHAALKNCHAAGVSQRIVFVCEWPGDNQFHSIRSDNVAGASMAIRHLYDLGHRRIAHVTGPAGNVLTTARRKGAQSERDIIGLPVRDEWIIRGDFSLESGRQAAEQILAMQERPTAVFCAADMVAFGLISRLQESGVVVPRDMSVVGFDDIEMSGSFLPALTTIRQDRQKIGQLAAMRLLQRIADPKMENGVDLVEVKLVKRASTAALSI